MLLTSNQWFDLLLQSLGGDDYVECRVNSALKTEINELEVNELEVSSLING